MSAQFEHDDYGLLLSCGNRSDGISRECRMSSLGMVACRAAVGKVCVRVAHRISCPLVSACDICQSNDAEAGPREYGAFTCRVAKVGADRYFVPIRIRIIELCVFQLLHARIPEAWSTVLLRVARILGTLVAVLRYGSGGLRPACAPRPETARE